MAILTKISLSQPRTSLNNLSDSKKEFEDLINDGNRHQHRFLRIFNDVMISILTTIANRHNISDTSNSTESCKNFIKDHASLLEAIRIYKMEKNSKYQQRAKLVLQQIFYKYARVYLIARKGYKDFQSSHRSFVSKNEEIEELGRESLEMLNQLNFTTNDARQNSIESIAILVLEIFGAMLALTLGLWTHLEQFDWTTFE